MGSYFLKYLEKVKNMKNLCSKNSSHHNQVCPHFLWIQKHHKNRKPNKFHITHFINHPIIQNICMKIFTIHTLKTITRCYTNFHKRKILCCSRVSWRNFQNVSNSLWIAFKSNRQQCFDQFYFIEKFYFDFS
jgi:hypothetical protein